MEGNAKATMRLVLALAAHFKPTSVKPPVHQSSQSGAPTKLVRSPSAAAAAAEAAAAIGEASRKHASVGRHIRMPFRLRYGIVLDVMNALVRERFEASHLHAGISVKFSGSSLIEFCQ